MEEVSRNGATIATGKLNCDGLLERIIRPVAVSPCRGLAVALDLFCFSFPGDRTGLVFEVVKTRSFPPRWN
jgi:hypothetical protein